MSSKADLSDVLVWRQSWALWCILLISIIAIMGMAHTGIIDMMRIWDTREEYGYGYIIPFITLFLIWQHKDVIEKVSFTGSWFGLIIVLLGVAVTLAGNLTTISTLIQYGMLVTLLGVVYAYMGTNIRPIIVPLLFLAFMIPLPGFFLNNLSSYLQLISSEIGVAVIRLFGISVYLEGNVIDLGTYQLQVVEACSGLNYLFPLMSLAFIAAYFFKAPFWQRATVFITSIPITVLMNSFRIGVIGVLVENWGIEQAEGFLHSFEGWIIFMACMLILFGEMWLFSKFSSDKKSLSEAFGIDLPEETPENAEIKYRSISRPLIASVLIVLVGASMSAMIETREEIIPDRISFDSFPSSIEDWKGADDIIEKKYLDVLKLDDYILANYTRSDGETANFYSAYYRSQRGGASAHSPRSCIPGGGWQIKDFKTTQIDEVEFRGKPLSVNRLLIKKGDNGQLVYYWFQQRGRIITNEYLVKFYLFWDALTINRTDGALVRLTTTIQPGEDVAKADKRLTEFARLIKPALSQYIPE